MRTITEPAVAGFDACTFNEVDVGRLWQETALHPGGSWGERMPAAIQRVVKAYACHPWQARRVIERVRDGR